ncbi:hypothetical protein KGF54_005140 [Candida jiufengensis]|uniref:uncharacterized protein n=1 Tax=Candida jiufengensis TaxID=497108 RepID=UPI002224AA04|nr:uncharacterized protein KGF54_005140 [Candida jiufengensis]KAI5950323.1 hypothetical protein KGF54_005140 [Candida jiufengensis]
MTSKKTSLTSSNSEGKNLKNLPSSLSSSPSPKKNPLGKSNTNVPNNTGSSKKRKLDHHNDSNNKKSDDFHYSKKQKLNQTTSHSKNNDKLNANFTNKNHKKKHNPHLNSQGSQNHNRNATKPKTRHQDHHPASNKIRDKTTTTPSKNSNKAGVTTANSPSSTNNSIFKTSSKSQIDSIATIESQKEKNKLRRLRRKEKTKEKKKLDLINTPNNTQQSLLQQSQKSPLKPHNHASDKDRISTNVQQNQPTKSQGIKLQPKSKQSLSKNKSLSDSTKDHPKIIQHPSSPSTHQRHHILTQSPKNSPKKSPKKPQKHQQNISHSPKQQQQNKGVHKPNHSSNNKKQKIVSKNKSLGILTQLNNQQQQDQHKAKEKKNVQKSKPLIEHQENNGNHQEAEISGQIVEQDLPIELQADGNMYSDNLGKRNEQQQEEHCPTSNVPNNTENNQDQIVTKSTQDLSIPHKDITILEKAILSNEEAERTRMDLNLDDQSPQATEHDVEKPGEFELNELDEPEENLIITTTESTSKQADFKKDAEAPNTESKGLNDVSKLEVEPPELDQTEKIQSVEEPFQEALEKPVTELNPKFKKNNKDLKSKIIQKLILGLNIVTPCLTPNKNYINFYNEEINDFFNYSTFDSKSKLKPSKISCDGSYSFDSTNPGAHWSSKDKNLFFNLLSRYSIHRLDLISEIMNKSSMEILVYYNLLQTELKKLKQKNDPNLVSINEIPVAYEMSQNFVRFEDEQSQLIESFGENIKSNKKETVSEEVKNKVEITNDKNKEMVTEEIPLNSLEESDQLINKNKLSLLTNLDVDDATFEDFTKLTKLITKKIILNLLNLSNVSLQDFGATQQLKPNESESQQDDLEYFCPPITKHDVTNTIREVSTNADYFFNMKNIMRSINHDNETRIIPSAWSNLFGEKFQTRPFFYDVNLVTNSSKEVPELQQSQQRLTINGLRLPDKQQSLTRPRRAQQISSKLNKIFEEETSQLSKLDLLKSRKYETDLIKNFSHKDTVDSTGNPFKKPKYTKDEFRLNQMLNIISKIRDYEIDMEKLDQKKGELLNNDRFKEKLKEFNHEFANYSQDEGELEMTSGEDDLSDYETSDNEVESNDIGIDQQELQSRTNLENKEQEQANAIDELDNTSSMSNPNINDKVVEKELVPNIHLRDEQKENENEINISKKTKKYKKRRPLIVEEWLNSAKETPNVTKPNDDKVPEIDLIAELKWKQISANDEKNQSSNSITNRIASQNLLEAPMLKTKSINLNQDPTQQINQIVQNSNIDTESKSESKKKIRFRDDVKNKIEFLQFIKEIKNQQNLSTKFEDRSKFYNETVGTEIRSVSPNDSEMEDFFIRDYPTEVNDGY